jgi:hypothetical protein
MTQVAQLVDAGDAATWMRRSSTPMPAMPPP